MSLLFPTLPGGRRAAAAAVTTSASSIVAVALVHAAVLVVLLTMVPAQRLAELARPLTVRLIELAPEIPPPPPPPKPRPEPPRPRPKPVPTQIVAVNTPGPVAGSSFTVAPPPVAVPPAPTLTPPPATPEPVPAPPVTIIAARFDAAYLNNPAPAYPNASRKLGEEGKVVLRVQVDAAGLAREVEIRTSSGFSRLDAAAREAVSQWRFVPARRGDEAIAAWVLVPIIFKLDS